MKKKKNVKSTRVNETINRIGKCNVLLKNEMNVLMILKNDYVYIEL